MGSGPPAGSSADAGKPGRLTAPVKAGQDRMDRAACELAPSAAGRAGIVCEPAGTDTACAMPSTPVEAPAEPFAAGRPRDPTAPEPGSCGNGSSPPGTTGETSPPTAPATGTSADPTGRAPTQTAAPVSGPTTPATGAATRATGPRRWPPASAIRATGPVAGPVTGLATSATRPTGPVATLPTREAGRSGAWRGWGEGLGVRPGGPGR